MTTLQTALSPAVQPHVNPIFEPVTATWQYIVSSPITKHAVIIDSVLDYDPATATLSTATADDLLAHVAADGLTVTHILDTHAHADHVSASRYLQAKLAAAQPGAPPPPVAIGQRIRQVQDTFRAKYGVAPAELDGAFDLLLDDDAELAVGPAEDAALKVKVLHLPGHTPDHVGYAIGSNVFVGDSLFNPDVGSARCDFPGGDAEALWDSTRKLLALPADWRVYTGHDYPPKKDGDGPVREPRPYYTVGEQREKNAHVGAHATENEFVKWRRERDEKLGEPRLLHYALQMNIRGGRLPKNGMLSVPVKGVDKVPGVTQT